MKEDVLNQAKSDLIDLIKREGEVYVDLAAEAMDLAKTTIRQHLTSLEDMGFLQTHRHRHGRGRPRKMYSLTDKAEQFFEKRDDEFLVGFLKDLIAQGNSRLIDDYIERRCQRVKDEMKEDGFVFDGDGIEATEEFLSRRGFMPRIERDEQDLVKLVLRNCPYSRVVESTQYICQVEERTIEGMLGRKITRTKHIGSGDRVCEYCVSPG
ncbi:MAG: helix-turn-helix transcriptional regulator [Myxococcota bacterium]